MKKKKRNELKVVEYMTFDKRFIILKAKDKSTYSFRQTNEDEPVPSKYKGTFDFEGVKAALAELTGRSKFTSKNWIRTEFISNDDKYRVVVKFKRQLKRYIPPEKRKEPYFNKYTSKYAVDFYIKPGPKLKSSITEEYKKTYKTFTGVKRGIDSHRFRIEEETTKFRRLNKEEEKILDKEQIKRIKDLLKEGLEQGLGDLIEANLEQIIKWNSSSNS